MGLFRQEYWSALPFPSPGALPDPGILWPLSFMSPALAGGFFTTNVTWELYFSSKKASFTLINYSSQAPFFNSVLTKNMWPLLMLLISVSLKESILTSLPWCYSLWEMSLLDSKTSPWHQLFGWQGRHIPSGVSSEICHKGKMDFPLLQILSIIKRIPIGWANLLCGGVMLRSWLFFSCSRLIWNQGVWVPSGGALTGKGRTTKLCNKLLLVSEGTWYTIVVSTSNSKNCLENKGGVLHYIKELICRSICYSWIFCWVCVQYKLMLEHAVLQSFIKECL